MTYLFVQVAVTKGTSPTSPRLVYGVAQLDSLTRGALDRAVRDAVDDLRAETTAKFLSDQHEEMISATLNPIS